MSNQPIFYDNGLIDFGEGNLPIEEIKRQQLAKENINLYYDDYYVKPKRKKTTKAKRSHSKRPGGRC